MKWHKINSNQQDSNLRNKLCDVIGLKYDQEW